MRHGAAFRIVSMILAAAVVLACAEFRAAHAAARSLTAAENAALAEIRSYLANYYGNAGDQRVNEIVNYAREQMLALDDENDWNADDGNRAQPVISPRPPDAPDKNDDPARDAMEAMLEEFRKEELKRQEDHYRKVITSTPKDHWSKDLDTYDRITPYEQELIDKIVAEKVAEQRKNLEEEFGSGGSGNPGKYIDDAEPGKPNDEKAAEWAAKIKEALDGFGGITGDLSGFFENPIGKIIDTVVEKITGKLGAIPAVGKAIGVFVEVMEARLHKYYITEEEYPEGFFTAEFPALLGAGVGLIVAAGITYGISQALGEFAPVADAAALGAALALDISINITRSITKGRLENWEKEIEINYAADHAALDSFAYRSSLPGVMSAQSRMSVPGAASFVMDESKRAAVFDSLHPGYRTTPDNKYTSDIYIDSYKKIFDNWRDYAAAHKEISQSEADGLTEASGVVDGIKTRSQGAAGYAQQIQAHSEAKLVALQQTLKLRMDIARQVDVRARQALDRQQKREDAHAAFGRCVLGDAALGAAISGRWTLSAGTAY